jgi:hypothetical protein
MLLCLFLLLLLLSDICAVVESAFGTGIAEYDFNNPDLPVPDWFPTTEELETRSILVPPKLNYFKQFRDQKSIRWLALGGSNTVYGAYTIPLETTLREHIEKIPSGEFIFYNGGFSGTLPL